MKNTLLFTFLLLISFVARAQDISGQWYGVLILPGAQLRLVLNLTKNNNTYTATLDSPDQGAKGIPASGVEYSNMTLTTTFSNINAEYQGTLDAGNRIKGMFKQNGMTYPLELGREVLEGPKVLRPQEPAKPYAYYTEDVKFENQKEKITLAGTLSLPSKTGNFPVVILISGSGPQNRDEEIAGHKPFLVIADHLTKNGIAVLRYDDRGAGQSTGDFNVATSENFATDVESAISYLKTRKEINLKKIGLIGHSEGGLIAPMVAADSKDVAFIILLAGPGIPGDQIMTKQNRLLGKAGGMPDQALDKSEQMNKKIYAVLKQKLDLAETKKQIKVLLEEDHNNAPADQKLSDSDMEAVISRMVNSIVSPWTQFFMTYDPAKALEKVKCPVLALNGEKDLQVPPQENLEAIKIALEKGGNKSFTTKELPNLNHLFQESKTGAPSEYATIEQTFSPAALTEITNWIGQSVK
ncbi:alpha/beta hydrolase [Dyadobacter sp. CY345]|uniref:alpha/beta hydrolase family protein n=1 Tax=Dyadobacter sp. CY345 TaxID=2909335 RepID=UPI001F406872|nr:alpha/beta hydrolase [Dyadobacter sp. CY345]MCF2446045.1 alpha/beta hydrolase [Dyadobacter sp. CY345]